MSPKHPRPAFADRELALAWQSLSLLFGYPDERLLGELPTIGSASQELPGVLGDPIRAFVVHAESTPLGRLQADYVETFDSRRRCNLFLTYFSHGDTRKRGVALLRFKQTYLRSGYVVDASADHGGELPDHLCVVLEYAATVDRARGWGTAARPPGRAWSCCGWRCATRPRRGRCRLRRSARPSRPCAATSGTRSAASRPRDRRRRRSGWTRTPGRFSTPPSTAARS